MDNQLLSNDKLNNSCIICLDEDISNEPIISSCDNTLLTKICTCQYYAHNKCFILWYKTKPVCPICSFPINFQIVAENTNEYNEYNEKEYISFMKKSVYFIYFSIIIVFFFNFFF